MTGQEMRTWAEIARDDAGDAAKELVDEFLSKALEHRSGAGLGALLHKALDDHLDLESWSPDALRGINDKAAEVVGGHYYLLIHYLFVQAMLDGKIKVSVLRWDDEGLDDNEYAVTGCDSEGITTLCDTARGCDFSIQIVTGGGQEE